eukprot:scaffold455269_cov17-Prasinocladus_malaysianus.AAC.1
MASTAHPIESVASMRERDAKAVRTTSRHHSKAIYILLSCICREALGVKGGRSKTNVPRKKCVSSDPCSFFLKSGHRVSIAT